MASGDRCWAKVEQVKEPGGKVIADGLATGAWREGMVGGVAPLAGAIGETAEP